MKNHGMISNEDSPIFKSAHSTKTRADIWHHFLEEISENRAYKRLHYTTDI